MTKQVLVKGSTYLQCKKLVVIEKHHRNPPSTTFNQVYKLPNGINKDVIGFIDGKFDDIKSSFGDYLFWFIFSTGETDIYSHLNYSQAGSQYASISSKVS